MKLQHELVLEQARYLGHATKPTKEDPKIAIKFRAALTREVADVFGCESLVFAGDVPRSGVAKMALEGEELDCEIHVRHDSVAFDAVASRIGGFVAKFEGTGPALEFKVALAGHSEEAENLARFVKIDPLELTLRPAQMDLGLQKAEGAEDGADDVRPADTEDGPALAPAVSMGGTHQNVDKRPRRQMEEDAEGEDDAEDFMSDIGAPVVN